MDEVRVITDPHVINAIVAIGLAMLAALIVWVLVLVDMEDAKHKR